MISSSGSKCFYQWVCKYDYVLALNVVNQIRLLHPTSPIVVISDGVDIPKDFYPKGITLDIQPFEKWLNNGDRFLINRYSRLLELSDAELFIKVDPDTVLLNKLSFPNSPWFGQTFKDPGVYTTWGCGMGLHRKLIEELVRSEPQNTSFTYKSVYGTTLLSEDDTLGFYLNQLGYSPSGWDGIALDRVAHSSLFNSGYSLVHPSYGKRIKQHYPKYAIAPPEYQYELLKSFDHRIKFKSSKPDKLPIQDFLIIDSNKNMLIADNWIGNFADKNPVDIWFDNYTVGIRERYAIDS